MVRNITEEELTMLALSHKVKRATVEHLQYMGGCITIRILNENSTSKIHRWIIELEDIIDIFIVDSVMYLIVNQTLIKIISDGNDVTLVEEWYSVCSKLLI